MLQSNTPPSDSVLYYSLLLGLRTRILRVEILYLEFWFCLVSDSQPVIHFFFVIFKQTLSQTCTPFRNQTYTFSLFLQCKYTLCGKFQAINGCLAIVMKFLNINYNIHKPVESSSHIPLLKRKKQSVFKIKTLHVLDSSRKLFTI